MKNSRPGQCLCLASILITGLMLGACSEDRQTSMVGTLERDRIELKVESNEPITKRFVKDGQEVKTGDKILEQDSSRAAARLAQQTALLEQSTARLAELESGPRQESIRQSRAQLESRQAQAINAAAELKRTQEIFDQGLSNQAALDRAMANSRTAQAEEQASREALAELLNGTRPEELQQAAAAVAANEAQVQQTQIDLSRATLTAPVNGIVDKVLYQLGERPPAGSTVAVLLDSSRVFARVYVPEDLRAHVKPGDQLKVLIDGVAEEFTGTVRWVSADASFTPYFALTEHDRSRLSYLAEIDLEGVSQLPSGVPLAVVPPAE